MDSQLGHLSAVPALEGAGSSSALGIVYDKVRKAQCWALFHPAPGDANWGVCCVCNATIKCAHGSTSSMAHHCRTHKDEWACVQNAGWLHPDSFNGRVDAQKRERLGDRSPDMVRDMVLRVFVTHCLQYNLGASTLFHDMLWAAGYKGWVPSREQQRLDIMAKYEASIPRVKELIQKVKSKLSWTFDIWDAPNDGQYLSTSIHWLDATWQKKTITCSFDYFKGSHTAERVADALLKVEERFELSGKLACVTIDNAGENVPALELAADILGVDGDHIIRCCAHIINLVCKVLYADATVKVIRAKVKAQVRAVTFTDNKQESFKELCELRGVEYVTLDNDNDTRWNSTWQMMVAAHKVHCLFREWNFANIEDKAKAKALTLDEEEWEKVADIRDMLKPYWGASVFVQHDHIPTLPASVGLYEAMLENFDTTEYPGWVKPTVTLMKAKLEKYYGLTSDVYYLATLLDPQHKMAWCSAVDPKGEAKYERIKKSCFKLLAPYFTDSPEVTVLEAATEKGRKEAEEHRQKVQAAADYFGTPSVDANGKKKKRPLSEVAEHNVLHRWEATVPKVDLVVEKKRRMAEEAAKKKQAEYPHEFESYVSSATLRTGDDPLAWWAAHGSHGYPNLAKAAMDYLAVPATTAASERAFSQGRQLISWTKHKLTPPQVESSMCLRSWLPHLPL